MSTSVVPFSDLLATAFKKNLPGVLLMGFMSIVMFTSIYLYAHFGISHKKKKRWMKMPIFIFNLHKLMRTFVKDKLFIR